MPFDRQRAEKVWRLDAKAIEMANATGNRWGSIPRWVKWLSAIVLVVVVLVVLRTPTLRGLGNALDYENQPVHSEVMFILSGSPFDRANEGAKLFREGWVEKIVCTGELIPHDFQALGLEFRESQLIEFRLHSLGIADSVVDIVPIGTSTIEESQVIMSYCIENNVRSAIVLSSKFHTRRIKKVFRKEFRKAGIELCIRGAPSSQYEEGIWWKSEYGLLAVNNEYVKMLWYLFK